MISPRYRAFFTLPIKALQLSAANSHRICRSCPLSTARAQVMLSEKEKFMTNPAHGVPVAIPNQPTRLIDQFRAWLRRNNYRYQTEQTYVHWVVAYIRFHDKQ